MNEGANRRKLLGGDCYGIKKATSRSWKWQI